MSGENAMQSSLAYAFTSLISGIKTKIGTLAPKPYKIAVIGDSLVTDYALIDNSWPSIVERYLKQCGNNVEVHNYAIGGFSLYATTREAKFNGKLFANHLADVKPDLVIVSLGLNDVMIALGLNRTEAEAKADATAFFSALHSAIPSSSKIVYVKHTVYDKENATISTMLNKHTHPFFWNRKTSGILTGLMTSEIENDAVSTDIKNRVTALENVYTHIQGLSQVDAVFNVDLFRVARLGGIGADTLHTNDLGKFITAGYIIKAMKTYNQLPLILSDKGPGFTEVDEIFTNLLQKSNGGWVSKPGIEAMNRQWIYTGFFQLNFSLDKWFHSHRCEVVTNGTAFATSEQVVISFRGAERLAPLEVSQNGSAFGAVATTDDGGNLTLKVPASFIGAGTHVYRYKIGSEVFGPVTFTITEDATMKALTSWLNAGWHDVTSSRALNQWYTNSRDYPIDISVDVGEGTSGALGIEVRSGGTIVAIESGWNVPGNFVGGTHNATIPARHEYRIAAVGTVVKGTIKERY